MFFNMVLARDQPQAEGEDGWSQVTSSGRRR